MTSASRIAAHTPARRYTMAVSITLLAIAAAAGPWPTLPPPLATAFFLLAIIITLRFAGAQPALVPALAGYLLGQTFGFVSPLQTVFALGGHIYVVGALSILVLGAAHRYRGEPKASGRQDPDHCDTFFDSAAISMRYVDAKGIIRQASQAELDVLGYPADEYVGRPVKDFHLDGKRALEISQRLAEGEELQDFPAQLRCRNGDVLDVMISARPVADSDAALGSLQFTQVVNAYAQEERSQALLAAIVAASDDAIISKSLEGIVQSWNAGAERLLGYSEEEMIGRSILTIVPPELREEESTILSRIRAGERLEHYETVRVTKDDNRIELSLTVSPIFDSRGSVIGASKVARDISSHKKAERALKASEERFRLMADSAPVLIWITDPAGSSTWFNRRWLDFTGRSASEEVDEGWTDGIHPDERQAVREAFRQCYEQHEHYIMEHRLRRADGEYRWLLVNALPLHHDDGFEGYIGSCVDITDRKQAEESLRLEDRRKTEFIATLAHELRNPLAPIRNSLEILKVSDDEPEVWSRSLDIIERQLTHMVRLVDDLLNISRINQDKLALRTERVALSVLVEQAVETVQNLLAEKGHKLHIHGVDEPITLQADPVRITQVLSNLLSNACKFTPPGGEISLSVHQQADTVTIAVKDTGAGIAPDEIHSVFDLFQQSADTREQSSGGLGIGLTLAKRLVEMHGGQISVRSAGPDQGSTFTTTLPVVALPAQHVRSATIEVEDVGTQRVLVVDDNHDSAETLAVLLRLDQHDVRTAHDGQQALREAEAWRPDLIFLDLGLPDIDGIEVGRQLRSKTWGKCISIIALTGWGQEEDRRRSAEAGFDEHMVKPLDREQLTEVLARHANRAFVANSHSALT